MISMHEVMQCNTGQRYQCGCWDMLFQCYFWYIILTCVQCLSELAHFRRCKDDRLLHANRLSECSRPDDLQITVDSLSEHPWFEKQSKICLLSEQHHNYMTCKNILQILAHSTDALGLSYMRPFPLCTLQRFEYILHSTLYFHYCFIRSMFRIHPQMVPIRCILCCLA